jgi:hypothetical protein
MNKTHTNIPPLYMVFQKDLYNFEICIYKNWCICVCVCSSITLERLERFRPNLIHILLYVCVRILCIYYMYSQGGWCGRQGIWMIHIVEEIKLLLLLGNRLKHIRGNVRYLVTWNVKVFAVGYFLRLDKFFLTLFISNQNYSDSIS